MVMAAIDRKITRAQLLLSWVIVYFGNLIGAAELAVTIGSSGLLKGPMATTAAAISQSKASLLPFEAFYVMRWCVLQFG